MNFKAALRVLLGAAEQAPETDKTTAAMATVRRKLVRTSPTLQDYEMILSNSGRALACIADGFEWAADQRRKGVPYEKIAPIVIEQNRKAAELLKV